MSILYLCISFANCSILPGPLRVLTFHVPNLLTCLGHRILPWTPDLLGLLKGRFSLLLLPIGSSITLFLLSAALFRFLLSVALFRFLLSAALFGTSRDVRVPELRDSVVGAFTLACEVAGLTTGALRVLLRRG